MILHVHSDGPRLATKIVLEEADVFTTFSIRAEGLGMTRIEEAFGPGAKADSEGHVWVPIEHLKALGEEYGGPDWRAGCDGMIDFARSKGWVDPSGNLVRAHVEC